MPYWPSAGGGRVSNSGKAILCRFTIDLVDQFPEFAFRNRLLVLGGGRLAVRFQCGRQPFQMLAAELEFFDEGFEFIGFDPDALRNFFFVHIDHALKAAMPDT